jgi:hypothetical protein
MTSIREKAGSLWRQVSALLALRRDSTPVDSFARLANFVATRSAFVAQKALYGYVKARMGTRYPLMFDDDRMIASLNIAKLNVFDACVSDLTVFAVGLALHNQGVVNDDRRAMASRCYGTAMRSAGEGLQQFPAAQSICEFERRLETTEWEVAALSAESFVCSPRALIRWAPIADELKRFDTEIIENSIKFAWRDVRQQLRDRIDGDAIHADWLRQEAYRPNDPAAGAFSRS